MADDEQLENLIERSSELELPPPPAPVSTGFWWRLLDRVGPYLAYGAAGLTAIIFLVATLGGPDFAWIGNLYYLVFVMLVLYIPYLLRRRQQERAAAYLQRLQNQEEARREIARLVLEQSQPNQKPPQQ